MLKNFHKKIFLLFIVIVSLNFCFISPVQAGVKSDLPGILNDAGRATWGGVPTGETSMAGIVATAVKAFLGLLGIIFLVLIIYAGFTWMTAQGDEEKVNTAKDTLTRAVIGLIIIVTAYAITYFVFSSLPGQGGGGSGTSGENLTR